eukprot:1683960-Rhodomonas_salina.2
MQTVKFCRQGLAWVTGSLSHPARAAAEVGGGSQTERRAHSGNCCTGTSGCAPESNLSKYAVGE